jgi:hypothetical protein
VIDPAFLTVEAGGAAYDIDGEGDLGIVFGGDSQSNELWWWEALRTARHVSPSSR